MILLPFCGCHWPSQCRQIQSDQPSGWRKGSHRHFKPQTTRTRITGVITRGPLQYVLLDTPGVHKARNKLGKRMDKTASDSIADVDVSMMLFEPYGALNESEMVLVDMLRSSGRQLQSSTRPTLSRSLLIWKPAKKS